MTKKKKRHICKNNILGILQRFVVKKEKLLMDINGNIYLNYIPTSGQNLYEGKFPFEPSIFKYYIYQ